MKPGLLLALALMGWTGTSAASTNDDRVLCMSLGFLTRNADPESRGGYWLVRTEMIFQGRVLYFSPGISWTEDGNVMDLTAGFLLHIGSWLTLHSGGGPTFFPPISRRGWVGEAQLLAGTGRHLFIRYAHRSLPPPRLSHEFYNDIEFSGSEYRVGVSIPTGN